MHTKRIFNDNSAWEIYKFCGNREECKPTLPIVDFEKMDAPAYLKMTSTQTATDCRHQH